MSRKSLVALVISIAAVIAVVVEEVGFEDGGDWAPLARQWVVRTYAALAVLGAWWLARVGARTDRNRGAVSVLWLCRVSGTLGTVWLANMAYAAISIFLES
jgi:hypothetical protein